MNSNGLILIDKPAGKTSMQVDSAVKRALGTRKVGHSGTLDPFATGLLPVYAGEGLKFVRYTDGYDKAYRCRIRFGASTDTMDTEGEVLDRHVFDDKERMELSGSDFKLIRDAFVRVTSRTEQMPPKYSAKKINGRKAYELAREGAEVKLEPQKIRIWDAGIESIGFEGDDLEAVFSLSCSKGTYIRVICDDWGRECGLFAHARELRRTKAGPFSVEDAITLERFTRMAEEGDDSFLRDPKETLSFMPLIGLTAKDAADLKFGRKISAERYGTEPGLLYRAEFEGALIAVVYEASDNGRKILRIDRMLAK